MWTLTQAPVLVPAHRELPVSASPHSEPLRVTKQCRLAFSGERLHFMGAGAPVCYEAVSQAICARDQMGYGHTYAGGLETRGLPAHQAPGPGCTCGFYAVKGGSGSPASWTIEAELYGRVIEHAAGWRAGRQRVLSLRAPTTCQNCGSRPPLFYLNLGGSGIFALCDYCGGPPPLLALSLEDIRAEMAPVEVTG